MSNRRRQRYTSPLDRARNTALRYILRPYRWFAPARRFYIVYGFFVIVTTLLLFNSHSRGFIESYDEGEIIRRTVTAPADISVMDWTETEKRRGAAKEAARPVFTFDPTRAESAVQSFRAAWEDLQKQAAAQSSGNNNARKELKWAGEGDRAI